MYCIIWYFFKCSVNRCTLLCSIAHILQRFFFCNFSFKFSTSYTYTKTKINRTNCSMQKPAFRCNTASIVILPSFGSWFCFFFFQILHSKFLPCDCLQYYYLVFFFTFVNWTIQCSALRLIFVPSICFPLFFLLQCFVHALTVQ